MPDQNESFNYHGIRLVYLSLLHAGAITRSVKIAVDRLCPKARHLIGVRSEVINCLG